MADSLANSNLDRWRSKLTTKLLRIFATIGGAALLYTTMTSPVSEWFYPALMYFVVFGMAVTSWGGTKLRSALLIIVLLIVGILILDNYGVVGGSRPYLAVSVILAAVMFGQKVGFLLLAFTLVEMLVVAKLSLMGMLEHHPSAYPLSTELNLWVWFVLSYFLCTTISLYSVTYLIKRLDKNFSDLRQTALESAKYLLAEKESTRKYKLLAENVTDVIWTLDLDLNYTYVSPSVFRSRGYTPEEVMAIGLDENFSKIPLPEIQKLLAAALASEANPGFDEAATLMLETQLKHKNGHWIDVELLVNFIKGDDEQINGILGVSRENGGHKTFERALDSVLHATKHKQGADYFDSLVENLRQALDVDIVLIGEVKNQTSIATLAVSHRGVKVDNFEYDLAGTPCDVVGEEGACTYPKDVQALFPEDALLVDMGMNSYIGISIQNEVDQARGIVVAMDSKNMDNTQLGEKLLAIFASQVNIELQRQEKEREQASIQQQLLHSQKIESIGQLSGGIAHDFNNLLVVIQGYVDLAIEHEKTFPELEAYLGEIKIASDRASELTSQLLSFSRRHIMKFSPLDLNDLISGLSGLLTRLIPEHINYRYIPGIDLGIINGDSGQLEQAIVNLAVNARDAMPDGGSLTIETENILIDQSYMETHPGTSVGRFVLLRISDTGTGIAQEMQDKIFDPFFTTKPEGQGTGLGLSVYFGIVKQHGGFAHLYSEEGRGSEFRTYLPIVQRSASSLERKTESKLPRGQGTILLVEDDKQVRELAVTILTRAGYQVITAEDGELALEAFRAHHQVLDLVLLDVVLPKLDGKQVLKEIQALDASIPVLFVSGYSSNGIHTNFILEDDLVLLQKPYSAENLLRKVSDMILGKSP